ncbi:AmmeMemoRadiSam system protein A [Clostridia bacterium]|nr:AmmeMemoRadiSam system protein A [Clostridia bacterium]
MNSEKKAILRLAKEAVESYARGNGKIDIPEWLPKQLSQKKAAVFVSLKKEHLLRGCIGTLEPTCSSLAQEVIEMAVEASSHDPRFPKVQAEELENLTYSVDILSETEPVASVEELDVKRYGVIVSSAWRRGVLLPCLEGVDSVQTQIEIALKKAGIKPNEKYEMERFEVTRCSVEEDDLCEGS